MLSLLGLISGPCPPHIHDSFIENAQCKIKVREHSTLMNESHAHLRVVECGSKCYIVIIDRVKSVLKLRLAAQIQVLVLGASIENVRDLAEF